MLVRSGTSARVGAVLLLGSALACLVRPASASTIYVAAGAPGANNGTTWADAYVDLQSALAAAVTGDEIWVKAGNYKPTSGTDRFATFQLRNGVAVYGGFAGSESSRDQRDWVTNATILSGDIGEPGPPAVPAPSGTPSGPLDAEHMHEQYDRWREVTLRPAQGASSADVVMDNCYHVVTGSGTDATAVLDGFTVTDGYADVAQPGNPDFYAGAGMMNVAGNPTLSNLAFTGNAAAHGGAVANYGASSPTFHNVTIDNNWSTYQGGGMYNGPDSGPTLDTVLFHQNYALVGGGLVDFTPNTNFTAVTFDNNYGDDGGGGMLHNAASLVLEGAIFLNNRASNRQYGGGGLWAYGTATLTDIRFEGNVGNGGGGGLHLSGGGALTNVRFVGNRSDWGGGIYCPDGLVTLHNVSFFGNSAWAGGGMAAGNPPCCVSPSPTSGQPLLVNSTFSGNVATLFSGGGLYSRDVDPTLVNAILWGDTGPSAVTDELGNENAVPSISYSLVQGSGGSGAGWDASLGTDGGHNLDADPLFLDVANDDLHLTVGSPAVNTGNVEPLPPGLATDLDGNPRIYGPSVDLGVYELQVPDCAPFEVAWGQSWDGVTLQEVLDARYGAGAVNAATDYEGHDCGDSVYPYWLDTSVDGWMVREIAGAANTNELGWYVENFNLPVIDGVDDGVIFTGPMGEGAQAMVTFPAGATRVGFYLNPNGPGDATNAPEPEKFFTNRHHNDVGPDGSGIVHPPEGGDPQCLIYNISHLRNGTPTYVLAWEDADSGSPLAPQYEPSANDNDYQDLVVEVRALSPVPALTASLTAEASEHGVDVRWQFHGSAWLDRLQLLRSTEAGPEQTIKVWQPPHAPASGSWTDATATGGSRHTYRMVGEVQGARVSSPPVEVQSGARTVERSRLLAAVPNPFNPATRIDYQVAGAERATVRIYDIAGRLVREWDLGESPAGRGSLAWDGRDRAARPLASGVYVAELRAGGSRSQMRLVLAR